MFLNNSSKQQMRLWILSPTSPKCLTKALKFIYKTIWKEHLSQMKLSKTDKRFCRTTYCSNFRMTRTTSKPEIVNKLKEISTIILYDSTRRALMHLEFSNVSYWSKTIRSLKMLPPSSWGLSSIKILLIWQYRAGQQVFHSWSSISRWLGSWQKTLDLTWLRHSRIKTHLLPKQLRELLPPWRKCFSANPMSR